MMSELITRIGVNTLAHECHRFRSSNENIVIFGLKMDRRFSFVALGY